MYIYMYLSCHMYPLYLSPSVSPSLPPIISVEKEVSLKSKEAKNYLQATTTSITTPTTGTTPTTSSTTPTASATVKPRYCIIIIIVFIISLDEWVGLKLY